MECVTESGPRYLRNESVQDSFELQEKMKQSKEEISDLLKNLEEPLKGFKRNLYENNFYAYLERHKPILDLMERIYLMCDEPEAYLNELADCIIRHTEDELALLNRRKKQEYLLNRNMALVIYINPAIVEHNKSSGKEFVHRLLKKWKQSFPETNLKYSTFEQINSGFNKRFCYITTAVCESLNKPDDCYELTLFRNYRDFYLMEQENGLELIREYYDKAPTIVKRIDKHRDSKKIYRGLWKNYLFYCVRYIEEGDNEKCLDLYRQMVRELIEHYFKQEGEIA